MTADERRAMREMSDEQIRAAQDLVRAQQPIAYRDGNTVALVKLQEWEQDYANEIFSRHFTPTNELES